jgi:5-methylcytosine-specific restriction endonuclease McrA
VKRPNYQEYIKSRAWFAYRRHLIGVMGNCCEFCGSEPGNHNPLQLHHLTYKNLGNETFEDLFVLCLSCHEEVHTWPKRKREVAEFAARQQPVRQQRLVKLLEELRSGTVA